MAQTRSIAFFALGLLIAVIAGCQSQSMVQNLPAPNFNGPTISPQAVAVVAPTPTPTQSRPTRAPTALANDRLWAPPVAPRPWKWIIIHHSASPAGSAAVFDREHRERGFDELGYDFVIGNGTNSGNGQVEIGSRWVKQKIGAHDNALDNRYNEYGIGICLVGNFDIDRPTQQQLQSLSRLTAYLMQKYHIPASNVLGHGETKDTHCPGRNLSVPLVRNMATQMLAEAGIPVPEDEARPAAGTELLFDPGQP
jgi:hypothetical protein